MSDWSEVESVVSAAEALGIVGASVIGPGGEHWSRHGDRQFRAASIVKVPLMVELFRQIERGVHRLTDTVVLRSEDKANGSGVLRHLHDGIGLTLNDLIYLMISISDNTATNLLIERVGIDAVNVTMRSLGMTGSNLGRPMKGRGTLPGEIENYATPDDYAVVVSAILDGTAASPESCESMVQMLTLQQNPGRIARYLPAHESVRWGSKTGSNAGIANDVGFVTADGRTMVIAVFCEGFPDLHVAEEVIGQVSSAALRDIGLLTPLLPTAFSVGAGA